MYQIKYKYSLKWDIIWAYRTIKNSKWLKSKKIIIFRPNIWEMLRLWFKKPVGPILINEFPVICYWCSSGSWGSYCPPDKIFICPRDLKNIEKVILHEIKHLKYNKDVIGMNHEEKEDYINKH